LVDTDEEAIRRLVVAFGGFKRRQWAKSPVPDLKPSAMFLLWRLKRRISDDSGGLRVKELAEELHVSPPHVTQTIHELEAKGFVRRDADGDDRRVVRLSLTVEGETVLLEAKRIMQGHLAGLVRALGVQRSLLLAELLDETNLYFDGGCI